MKAKTSVTQTNCPLRTACVLLPLLILVLSLAGYAGDFKVLPEDFNWSDNGDGTCTITRNTGFGGDLVIPDTLDGLTVTTIGDVAFDGCRGLTSVTIPDSVTTIRVSAFNGCSGLTSVTIPDSVTTIGDAAFSDCSGLTSVTIGNSVTTIGDVAFDGCRGLTSVTIPDSVTTIGKWAFNRCSTLTSVTIGNSVTTIGFVAFAGCSGLMDITVDPVNPAYTSVDGVLFNKNQKELVGYPRGKAGAYTIPDSVTSIGDRAFLGSTLTSVTIGKSVTTIRDLAFRDCSGLMDITVDPANSAYTSASGVLFNKSQTKLIKYPGGKAGAYTIGDSVTAIGKFAFARCSTLTSITIGKSVTTIWDMAFYDCSGLMDITVDPANSAYTSVAGVLFNKGQTELVGYPGGKAGAYTIPGSVTTIGKYSFSGCSGLTGVTIPDSVTTIGKSAFSYCRSLTSIFFKGDSPGLGRGVFFNVDKATVYYLPGATGWEKTYGDRPTALWPDSR